ncbi:MAG TPA: DM13 domain-containing protein [Acidimicrobiales bacterium]|nr:DM13 domain-containing protein [Acidimicrobiales bacterium]
MTDLLAPDTTRTARRRRRWPWVAAALAAGLVAVVLVWFQPQKLLIDERVTETLPTTRASTPTNAVPSGPPEATAPAPSAEPVELTRGSFISRDHGTEGVVRVLAFGDGRRIVRLEGLDTDNGPDLYLYLSPTTAGGDESAFDDGHLNLGRLKGNLGDQNYDLPAGADLARYRSVVIWCDRFNSAFGAADLA